ncbi:MAG: hypothetical protein ACREE4_17465 [Stellaceae bacterium]
MSLSDGAKYGQGVVVSLRTSPVAAELLHDIESVDIDTNPIIMTLRVRTPKPSTSPIIKPIGNAFFMRSIADISGFIAALY